MSRRILVGRLERFWCPAAALGLKPRHLACLDDVEPLAAFKEVHRRGTRYHQRRIRHFMDRLLAGEELDPITIDNYCDGGHIYAHPIVDDGNHRLLAHILIGRETIQAEYGGRIDLLNFLQGRRKNPPID
jgi:hypothetical protein